MKYIDAEHLIHDLEERIYAYSEGYADGDNCRKDAIETLLKDVRYQCSLQQEQEQYVIGGQVFGATDVNQLYEGKVYIISNLVQDTEFGLSIGDKVKMLLMKD